MAEPEPDHLHALVAHYLSTQYPAALPPFLHASGAAPPDPSAPPTPDLRTLVSDARAAQLSARLARATLEPGEETLEDLVRRPLPPQDALVRVDRTLEHVSAGNLLAVRVGRTPRRSFTPTGEHVVDCRRRIVVAGADRAVRVVEWDGEVSQILEPHKAPVLALALHPTNGRYLASGAMDGTVVLSDLTTGRAVQTLALSKFVVRVAFSEDGRWLAALSYDKSVSVFEAVGPARWTPDGDEDEDWKASLGDKDDVDAAHAPRLKYELRHRQTTDANPEAVAFAGQWLMYTVRGVDGLHYLRLPGGGTDWEYTVKSFNPHPMDTHVSFSVLDLAVDPSGRLVAGITGDHATGGERVVVYGVQPEETDRLACIWTTSEPDMYVLPRLAFLPSGLGVVTTAASGELTLLGLNGEVRSKLKTHAAMPGVAGTSDVVRDLAVVPDEGDEGLGAAGAGGWVVVSVGYDRTVKITRGEAGRVEMR